MRKDDLMQSVLARIFQNFNFLLVFATMIESSSKRFQVHYEIAAQLTAFV